MSSVLTQFILPLMSHYLNGRDVIEQVLELLPIVLDCIRGKPVSERVMEHRYVKIKLILVVQIMKVFGWEEQRAGLSCLLDIHAVLKQ